MQRKKGSIHFEPNYRKTLEAILYILSKNELVNIYNIMKIMFAADKHHLNSHCRPVTGDVYIKMPYGTVPSVAYDMAKLDPLPLAFLEIEEYPFKRQGNHLNATRAPDLRALSKSDVEALDFGIQEYLSLDFPQARDKNHTEKCWIDGEPNGQISYESMIENPEVLEYLKSHGLTLVV